MATVTHVERWNVQHRIQHLLMVTSMVGLLGTGLAMKYHYVAWAKGLFSLLGGFHNTLIIHKAAAILLVVDAVYHIVYLLVYWRRHGASWSMLPSLKDVRDAGNHGLYLLGLRPQMPSYERYSYLEKFEYLAIVWGMVVMGGTGFSLWFPEAAGSVAPRWILDAFRIVHSNEAFVALISLAFGHFFFVIFSPNVFPFSPVFVTGKMTAEELWHEHPLEYQRLVEQGKLPAGQVPHHPPHLSGWRRLLAFIEILLYSAIFYWLLVSYLPLLFV